jgi:hypothetical protein
MMCSHVAVESALAVDVHAGDGHPVSFLVRTRDSTIRADAQADGMAEASRIGFYLFAVPTNAKQATTML